MECGKYYKNEMETWNNVIDYKDKLNATEYGGFVEEEKVKALRDVSEA